MYSVVTRIYDRHEVISEPMETDAKESYSKEGDNYDMYVDVFKTYEEARDFYEEQMRAYERR